MSIASLSHFGKFVMSIVLYRPTLVNVLLSLALYRPSSVLNVLLSIAVYRPSLLSFIVDRVISSQFSGECFTVRSRCRPFLVNILLSSVVLSTCPILVFILLSSITLSPCPILVFI